MSCTLHLVNKSPAGGNAISTCLRMAKPGDSILLIEDGVYAALADADFADILSRHMGDFTIFVLGPDVAARGLADTGLIMDIGVLDYEGFVDLVAENDLTQSWL